MSFVYRGAVTDSHLVYLSGSLNADRSQQVVQLFVDLAERGVRRVVVHMEDVPFIDSQGLAALIRGFHLFGSDVKNFRLTGVQVQPLLVFELTGFDRVFDTDDHSGNGPVETVDVELPGHLPSGPSSFAYVSHLSALDLAA